eukprot:122068-Pelagomonas_calceolata.AAC.3
MRARACLPYQDDIVALLDLIHQLLQALLKFTPVLGASHQQTHVQRHHLYNRTRGVICSTIPRQADQLENTPGRSSMCVCAMHFNKYQEKYCTSGFTRMIQKTVKQWARAPHLLALNGLGHVAVGDLLGQALSHSGLTNTRLANKARVVLGAAAQNLNDALNLLLAANHGVQLALEDMEHARSTSSWRP